MKIKLFPIISGIALLAGVVAIFFTNQLLQVTAVRPSQLSPAYTRPVPMQGWSLYTDPVNLFSIHHPTNATPLVPAIVDELDAVTHILHIPTATDTIIRDLVVSRADDPISGVNVYTSSDPTQCNRFSASSSTAVIIGNTPFKTASWSDAAAGGERGIIREYHTLRYETCYIIESIVHYRDIDFLSSVTGATSPKATSADITTQTAMIAEQQKIHSSIISSFLFAQ